MMRKCCGAIARISFFLCFCFTIAFFCSKKTANINTAEIKNTEYDIYFSNEIWSQQTIEEKELIASQYASKQLGEEVNVIFDLNISDFQTTGSAGLYYNNLKRTLYVKKDIVNNPESVKNTIDSYALQNNKDSDQSFDQVYNGLRIFCMTISILLILFGIKELIENTSFDF